MNMNNGVHYLQVQPEAVELPRLPCASPFRAVVLVREAVSNEWRKRVSDWLVTSGCLYMLAWGVDCSIWDDAVDWASLNEFDFGDIPPERFVMTTWHDDESIEEVFAFARSWATHPTVAVDANVILDISFESRESQTISAWSDAEVADR
jgi:hypothetical protein